MGVRSQERYITLAELTEIEAAVYDIDKCRHLVALCAGMKQPGITPGMLEYRIHAMQEAEMRVLRVCDLVKYRTLGIDPEDKNS